MRRARQHEASRRTGMRDRENRLFSLVLYFTDAEAAGWDGGEFRMLVLARWCQRERSRAWIARLHAPPHGQPGYRLLDRPSLDP